MGGTEGCNTARWSKSQKPSPVRIEVCNRPREAGIASNRESARHGEYVLESCTRVAMRSEHLVGAFIFFLKRSKTVQPFPDIGERSEIAAGFPRGDQ